MDSTEQSSWSKAQRSHRRNPALEGWYMGRRSKRFEKVASSLPLNLRLRDPLHTVILTAHQFSYKSPEPYT